MNKLSFKILPSPESNDHQVRILIDNKDWLHDNFLGIDPPGFFQQETFLGGVLLIGRCNCGVEGCGDLTVMVQSKNGKMIWESHNGLHLEFDKTEYLELIEFSKTDFKWEDTNRRVERLVSNTFKSTQTIDGLTFDWASCRIEENKVCLSYSKNGITGDYKQEILKIDWDGKTESEALTNANKFLETNIRIKK
jgi:hypothetical protein